MKRMEQGNFIFFGFNFWFYIVTTFTNSVLFLLHIRIHTITVDMIANELQSTQKVVTKYNNYLIIKTIKLQLQTQLKI